MITQLNLATKSELAEKWLALEGRADGNAFLSWAWIGHWLDMVTQEMLLIEAWQDNKIVGLGIFVKTYRRALSFFPVKQLLLHRTGEPDKDQIWIEHNDFLLDKEHSTLVREKMIEKVLAHDKSVNEYILGLCTNTVLASFTSSFKYKYFKRTLVETMGYAVNLTNISTTYLTDVVSKNTRTQVKRSKKLLEQTGELTFEVITRPQQISKLFEKISAIHIHLWQATVEGSGFTNPVFVEFYKSLVDEGKMLEVAALALNGREIGYLVNFVYSEQVYFYLSAITKNPDNRIKVGLVLHSEAVEHYQQKGFKSYDFLGGEAQYKKSLSDRSYSLQLECFTKKSFLLNIEHFLRTFNPFKKLQ